MQTAPHLSPSNIWDDVTIIMVTFNSAHVLPSSLPALANFKHVMVVDNASADNSCDLAAKLIPQATIIRNAQNLGFGRAHNIGLQQVVTRFALLLNPDCSITPSCVDQLLNAAHKYPDAAILTPLLLDQHQQYVQNYLPFPPMKSKRHITLLPDGDICAEWVVGAAMFMNMDLMSRVGFFDEWFFLFSEETDLCIRVRQHGFATIVVKEATAIHPEGNSSDPSRFRSLNFFRAYYCTLSHLYLEKKHRGLVRYYARMLEVLMGAVLPLPFFLLSLNFRLCARNIARIKASIYSVHETRQPHCSLPSE